MRFVDEYRDPVVARDLAARLERAVGAAGSRCGRALRVMEVCGGHTHAIYRHGLLDHVGDGVEFVHGPGCPVCVVPRGRLDDAVGLAVDHDVILCTYGDLFRVPGSRGSLLEARAAGADVRIVYSPLDVLPIAAAEPDREVVFLAIGFETTAPATAVTVRRARERGIGNLSFLCLHVLVEPPLRALLGVDPPPVDGVIAPGHVSTVTGWGTYRPLARELGIPFVVAGFEPLDVLEALTMVVERVADGRAGVANQYGRAVSEQGNPVAQALVAEVFRVRDTFEWRGLGEIPRSALELAPDYADLDAEVRFDVHTAEVPDHRACRCGDVLRGSIRPWECAVFGTGCTPERPLGSCMVSSEGACAAVYRYGRGGAVPTPVSERRAREGVGGNVGA